jgi:hypothetical protein
MSIILKTPLEVLQDIAERFQARTRQKTRAEKCAGYSRARSKSYRKLAPLCRTGLRLSQIGERDSEQDQQVMSELSLWRAQINLQFPSKLFALVLRNLGQQEVD